MQALIMFYARFGILAEAVVGILAEEIVDAKNFHKVLDLEWDLTFDKIPRSWDNPCNKVQMTNPAIRSKD